MTVVFSSLDNLSKHPHLVCSCFLSFDYVLRSFPSVRVTHFMQLLSSSRTGFLNISSVFWSICALVEQLELYFCRCPSHILLLLARCWSGILFSTHNILLTIKVWSLLQCATRTQITILAEMRHKQQEKCVNKVNAFANAVLLRNHMTYD